MNAIDKEKIDMNTTVSTNQRLVTVLLVLLISLLILLVIGTVVGFLMMDGGMMGWGGMMNGGMMNDMMNACTNMMQNFQNP
jgi:hypothetical protein